MQVVLITKSIIEVTVVPHKVPDPEIRFGIVWDSLVVDSGIVQDGQSLSHILDPYRFGPGKVATLAANSRKIYDVRNMRTSRRWWVASTSDSLNNPAWLVYERNAIDYVVFFSRRYIRS